MNTPVKPWIDLTLRQSQRCHHLAWFLYGWLEREQMLNVQAFVAWWVRGVAPNSNRSPALAASVTKSGADARS